MSDMKPASPVPRRAMQDEKPRVAARRVTAPVRQDDYKTPDESAIEYREHVERTSRNLVRAGCLLWVIAVICIAAVILGIGGLFSHATVTVVPASVTGDVGMTVAFSKTRAPGTVAMATATQAMTDEIIVPATGTATKESRATGKVRFYNANAAAKTIPAGTRIASSGGIAFQTAKAVTVPGKKGTVPGSTEAGIVAVASGAAGNIDPDDFVWANPKPYPGITIRSTLATTGGAKGTDSIADPAALAAAADELRSRMADASAAAARIATTVPDDWIVLPTALTPSTVTITNDPSHADGVHVIARQNVGVVMANRTSLARALGQAVSADRNIPLTIRSLDGVSIIPAGALAAANPPEQFSARVTGQVTLVGAIDGGSLAQEIAGKSRHDARTILAHHPEIQSFNIRMRPFWRRVVPQTSQITIDS